MDKLDARIMEYMCQYEIPHSSVGVLAGDGRLVYLKAFTNIDAQHKLLRASEGEVHLFPLPHRMESRIASLTKLFTFTGAVMLEQSGLFSFNDGLFEHLYNYAGADRSEYLDHFWDPKSSHLPEVLEDDVMISHGGSDGTHRELRSLRDITIRHAIEHQAGWCDRESEFDASPEEGCPAGFFWRPPHETREIANHQAVVHGTEIPDLPISFPMMYEGALSSGLGFSLHNKQYWLMPGTRSRYNNIGYTLLGELIQTYTMRPPFPYSIALTQLMRDIGLGNLSMVQTAKEGRLPGEVYYYPNGEPDDRLKGSDQRVESRITWDEQHLMPYGGRTDYALSGGAGGLVTTALEILKLTADMTIRRPTLTTSVSSTTTSSPSGVSLYTTTTRTVTPTFHNRLLDYSYLRHRVWESNSINEWKADNDAYGLLPLQSLGSETITVTYPSGVTTTTTTNPVYESTYLTSTATGKPTTRAKVNARYHTGSKVGSNTGAYMFPTHEPNPLSHDTRLAADHLHSGASFVYFLNRDKPDKSEEGNRDQDLLMWRLRDLLDSTVLSRLGNSGESVPAHGLAYHISYWGDTHDLYDVLP